MSNVCEICFEKFSKKYLLHLHKKVHRDGNKCLVCKEIFETASLFSEHLKIHISRQKSVEFQCGICLQLFNNDEELRLHFEGHNEPKIIQQVSVNRNALKATDYICKICGKAYKRLDLCKQHLLIHVADLSCDICQKRFTKYEHLLNHTRSHTKELPLQCSECTKAFYKNEHLMRHIRTHSKEKSYECDICGKLFGRKDNLRRHIQIHLTPRMECKICGTEFKSNLSLTAHMRNHTNNRPFECSQCKKGFVTAGNLKFHRKTHAESQTTLNLQVEIL